MVRLRHAIWRRVLGTLTGVLRRRVERSGVKGHAFLVERTQMNAAKERSDRSIRMTVKQVYDKLSWHPRDIVLI